MRLLPIGLIFGYMGTPKTVLVVDDDPQVASLIERMLERAGYRIITADGALAALEAVSGSRPDLMIIDLQLDGMGGLELVPLLRCAETRYTPAIAITGNLDVDADEVRAHGFVALVHKPFTAQELRRTVADCLD